MDLTKFQINNKFLMLALDHRASFKKLINPQNPETVSDETITQLKSDIINSLMVQFSSLLIDENYGLDAYPIHNKTFLLTLEKSSHNGLTELEYSVKDLINFGASGAKILIDFDPDSENVPHQLEIGKSVMEDCIADNFPLFLEIVTHSPEKVLQSLKKFLDYGIKPDVWKLEYPGSFENCQEVTKLVNETPWILLTGGQSFDDFKKELEIALKGGAKGFLAGRALWQEVCSLQGDEKQKFLQETLPERFKQLSVIAQMTP